MGWFDATLERTLFQTMAVGARVSMLMVFAPFFGSSAIPRRVKAALAVTLTALLYPAYSISATSPDVTRWVGTVAGEALVGLMLGLATHFIFDGVQMAGQVLGFQMGFSLANVVDPETQVDTPVLAIFHQAIALLIFLQIDAHHLMLRALGRSLEYLPPGAALATPASAETLTRAAAGILLVAVQLAAPVLVVTLLADVALGFLGKASPQLPVLLVGLSVKNVIGLGVMMAAVVFWPGVLGRMFAQAAATAERLLHLAR